MDSPFLFLFPVPAGWPQGVIWALISIDFLIRVLALGFVPRNRKPSVALGWLLAIFLIPYVGILAFWMFGSSKLPLKRREKQRVLNEFIKRRTGARAVIGDSSALSEPLLTSAQLNYELGALPMTHGNHLELLTDNHEAMLRMAEDVDAAKDYVHFEFYIVAIDSATKPLLDALLRAHERGVTVRVLVDHIGSLGVPGYSELVRMLDGSGIPWQRALPIRPWRGEYQRPDLRNHRKILVIDGDVGYTGSQNIVHRSYNKRRNLRKGFEWKDLTARCTGPVVAELNGVFASDWYSETDVIIRDEFEEQLKAPVKGGVLAQVVPSGPGFDLENNLRLFNHLIYNANHTVVICSPYFVPDESLMHALVTEALSGVDIRLYVGATSDSRITQKAQESYYDELVAAGVRIFQYHAPTVLHSKFLIIDDEVAIIGSSNMDERSFAMNMEVTLYVVSEEFVQSMYTLEASDYRKNSVELDVEAWNNRKWYRRYVESVARLTSSLL
ncbi:cardiolipin synthase [Brevibacterium samyangense]|uniref:Cardiolipin synthase n=1 Tax=Brevibacterium samyangense TaxID=366888 RepID=A0ABN2TEZ9_9MICO